MKIIDFIINLIYPNVCGFCENINFENICPKCNLKIEELKKLQIYNYSHQNFRRHLCIFEYKGEIRDKIIEYKFSGKSYIYETFVKIILKDKKICSFLKNYAIIIPVPISKKRKQQRGYNQSELIAKKLANSLENVKCITNVLYKKINTKPQSILNKEERKSNIKGAYEVRNKQIIVNKNILLLDDIFTTGNTVQECSKVLKEAGAKNVDILTLAKD